MLKRLVALLSVAVVALPGSALAADDGFEFWLKLRSQFIGSDRGGRRC